MAEMGITIALPGPLQPYAAGHAQVALPGGFASVGDALRALSARHAGVTDRIVDERGEVREHVNVFVDGDNIRFLEGLRTPLGESSTIVVVAAVSGG
jgi:molybdopterin converting factor small subunit